MIKDLNDETGDLVTYAGKSPPHTSTCLEVQQQVTDIFEKILAKIAKYGGEACSSPVSHRRGLPHPALTDAQSY